MNKHDFLNELSSRLARLPDTERDKAYAFYAEIIDDSMEDGMSEEEAVGKLGSLDEITERIIAEVPMSTIIKHRVAGKNRGLYMVLLLICGFPIWFPILISLFSVLLTLFIVFWIVDLVVWVVFGSVAAAAVGSCIGFFLNPEFGMRLLLLGGALACSGCAILLFPASVSVTKQFALITCQLWMKLKNAMLKKGGILQ
ncbi:MAG: DUF1700 domain-containing protein [Clostridiales bacterium]|nr:DUF1700 domain-containing protein [Clostridiales bacterium]